MKSKTGFVRSFLISVFRSLGYSIGRHPLPYCIVPLLATSLLSIGFYWINVVKDAEFLYCPENGRSLRERKAVESLFPPSNYSSDAASLTRFQQMSAVVLLPKDNLSFLSENYFDDAVEIDKIIRNVNITWKGETLHYKDVCLKASSSDCQPNDVLNFKGKIKSLKRKKLRIKFPINTDATNLDLSLYASGLGGVTVDENNYVVDVLALRLIYLLDHSTAEKREMSQKWEESFLKEILNIKLKNIRIFAASGLSINDQTSRLVEMAIPLLVIIIPLMGTFAVTSTMTSSCITSKPWIAIAACLSPLFGLISAFGILLTLGVPYIDLNILTLFLLIGIGLDDSFIMLAAWRRTDSKLKVEERLSETYSEAAVSITITSLTNCLSLCIGIASPYTLIRIYCIYAALSVASAYVYQITFFGSTMAISGIAEHKRLHSVLCFAIKKENVPGSSALKLIYLGCTDIERKDGSHEKPTVTSSYLNSFLCVMLTTKGKVTLMVTFLLYFLSSSYCLTFVKEDFNYADIMSYDSYLGKYLKVNHKYFSQYCHPVQIVINETLDYSSKQVQENIEEMLGTFSEIPNVSGKEYSFSWLKYYLESVNDKRLYFAYYGYNISDSNDFIAALRDVFLKFYSARAFQQHIKFNENGTKITSSRYVILSKDVNTSSKEKQLLSALWEKVDSLDYTVYVHNAWFPIYNLFFDIVSTFTTTLLAAIGLVTLAFIIIIPNLFCTISIFFTAVSIQIGVIGYMSIWDVPINPISMVSVMISVGLSVDYAAHVSYAYLSCKEDSPNKKTITAIRSTGYPIIQGSTSTLLGVVVLVFGPSRCMVMFAKVIILVILISLFHGIFVIPFALNSFELVWESFLQRFGKRRWWKSITKFARTCTKSDEVYSDKIANNSNQL